VLARLRETPERPAIVPVPEKGTESA
jgi:hypothetical protein